MTIIDIFYSCRQSSLGQRVPFFSANSLGSIHTANACSSAAGQGYEKGSHSMDINTFQIRNLQNIGLWRKE